MGQDSGMLKASLGMFSGPRVERSFMLLDTFPWEETDSAWECLHVGPFSVGPPYGWEWDSAGNVITPSFLLLTLFKKPPKR